MDPDTGHSAGHRCSTTGRRFGGNPVEKSSDTQMVSPTLFPSREIWRVYSFSLNGIFLPPKRKPVVLGAETFCVLNSKFKSTSELPSLSNGRGE